MRKGKSFTRYFIVTLCTSLLVFLLDGFYIFYRFNHFSQSKLFKLGTHINSELGTNVDNLLNHLVDFVEFTGLGTEKIMNENADYKDILDKYLLDSTDVFNHILGKNLDGEVYGVFEDYYPEIYDFKISENPEYKPKEREWYLKAKEADGEVVICGPYIDYETKEMQLTVSKLLSDKTSVIVLDFAIGEMDVFLDMLGSSSEYSTFIITDQGVVVAAKDVQKVFKDGVTNSSIFKKYYDKNTNRLILNKEKIEKFRLNGNVYFMFSKEISFDWYAITIYDSRSFYRDFIHVYISCIIAFTLIFGLIFFFARLNEKKRISIDATEKRFSALADLFLISYIINIKENTFTPVKTDPRITRFIGSITRYSDAIHEVCEHYVENSSVAQFMNFTELRTLKDRSKKARIISEEILAKVIGWCKVWFIRLDEDSYIFAVDSIDKEKSREHTLLKLSESDLMTGLLNHVSGLLKIKDMIENKKYGMFCLFDIDQFKHFNDMYGHIIGDKVIISLAGAMRESFRDDDIMMRLGGDEFIVYIQGIQGRTQAEKKIRKFFENVENIKIEGRPELKVNISMGVSFYKEGSDISYEKLYRLADSGTYQSKKIPGNSFTFV